MSVLGPQGHVQDKPIFHIAPASGWANDPNGPLYWRGCYHLFYQHIPSSVQWGWGLCWGHVTSSDMVHWQHHPPAICPTPGGNDADGCFSGCAVMVPRHQLDQLTLMPENENSGAEGEQQQQQQGGANISRQQATNSNNSRGGSSKEDCVPVLLYTGVVRRPDAPPGLRPSSLAVSELCYEQQLAAVAADPDDPYLTRWLKVKTPVLRKTPTGLCLNCFRDPFVLEAPSASNSNRWRVMVGAGIREPGTGLACAAPPPPSWISKASKVPAAAEAPASASIPNSNTQATGQKGGVARVTAAGAASAAMSAEAAEARRAANGTALVYSSHSLLTGWEYEGALCTARDRTTDGAVWECPMLVQLPTPAAHAHAHADGQHSSNSSSSSSYLFSVSTGSFPSRYWTGQYSNGRFDLESADGPYPMDMGDILYAPNICKDDKGRVILWAWLCELPRPAAHSQDYAGSMCLPRLLSRGPGGTLHQASLPQLQQLTTTPAWQADNMVLGPGTVRHIAADVPSTYFSLNITFTPNSTAAAGVAGFMLPGYQYTAKSATDSSKLAAGGVAGTAGHTGADTVSAGQGVVVLYDFSTCHLSVTVGPGVGDDILQAAEQSPQAVQSALAQYTTSSSSSNSSSVRRAVSGLRVLGGQLRLAPGEALELQVYMDYSLLELFTGCGQTLATRVYRGLSQHVGQQQTSAPTAGAGAGAAAATAAAGVPAQVQGSVALQGGGCDVRVQDASEPVPGGVRLLAAGQESVEVRSVKMAAMQSIWRETVVQ